MKFNFRKIKPKNKNLKHLPFIFLLSFSLQTLIGGILGYLISHFYVKKANEKQKKFIPSSIFVPLPFSKLKIKIHHWLYGFLGLVINFKLSLVESPFLLAILVGLVWHDLTDNRGDKWYLFLYRK